MKFRKIDDTKFQCILYQEDMRNFNISMEDFMRNDATKIHELLDIVIEKAYEQIGVDMDGTVMSLQLVPQPNQSLLLTVSGKKEDGVLQSIGSELRGDIGIRQQRPMQSAEEMARHAFSVPVIFRFESLEDFEKLSLSIPEVRGVFNALYKGEAGDYYLLIERKNLSESKYVSLITNILEYSEIYTSQELEISYIKEHGSLIFRSNAINSARKYCSI